MDPVTCHLMINQKLKRTGCTKKKDKFWIYTSSSCLPAWERIPRTSWWHSGELAEHVLASLGTDSADELVKRGQAGSTRASGQHSGELVARGAEMGGARGGNGRRARDGFWRRAGGGIGRRAWGGFWRRAGGGNGRRAGGENERRVGGENERSVGEGNGRRGEQDGGSSPPSSQERFVPEKFDETFTMHAKTVPDALTSDELEEIVHANREPKDYKGW
ncbi:hypothetical protein ABZP36_006006 [Zizania latifolia]